ncbi:cytochrome P450 [Streptosporangium sp. NPDC051023]|uniref:cytochrome P450 n=1 Tax=Streptosporangium sp. NPDC051023 TaxID=3155410 RepID=UPI00344EC80B
MDVDLQALARLPWRQRITESFAYFSAGRQAGAAAAGNQPGVWEVFRYDEAVRVLSAPETFSNDFSAFIPKDELLLAAVAQGNLAGMDPPRHRRLRSLVNKAFTPREVAALTSKIEKKARLLLEDALAATSTEGEIDVVREFASPLSATTIAELFGVPASDQPDFWRWSDAMLGARPQGSLGVPDEEAMRRKAAIVLEAGQYLLAHIDHLRAHPGEDLTSRLTTAEVDGERLSDEEILGLIGMFLIAGHLPTSAWIGNTVMCLDEHPRVADGLAGDLSTLPAVLEEVLRWRPPLTRDQRITKRDTELAGGLEVPAGAMVVVWIASANRDPEQFATPDVFDPHRSQPVQHLTLGKGVHFCIGSPLARLEARIAMETLLEHCPRPAVVRHDDIEFHSSIGVLGPVRLPISLRGA